MNVKTVAISTGGGDCPGLNAVIRAIVNVGIEKYGWEILGIEDAMMGLVDLDYRSPHGNVWLDKSAVRGLLAQGGTILGTSNRSDPFEYVVKQPDGTEQLVDVSDRVMANYKKLGLDALISIGGDGSTRISAKLIKKGMNIVGVPKTIDNDLAMTDQTFGFDTAVGVATDALDRLRDTAESHDRVILVEVMGREAGWIALHAGLAGGADVILLPEIPYTIEPIAETIRRRRAEGKNYSLLCVAEGARPRGGEMSVVASEAGAMPRLMGAANRVAEELQRHVEADIRVTVLGHIQRGGSPSSFDRILATRYGIAAAELVARKEFGKMVSLCNGEIVSVNITDVAATPKRVDPNNQIMQQARDLGVCFGE